MCCAMILLLQNMVEEDQGWLPNALVLMEHDNNRITEITENSPISKHLNI